VLDVTGACRPTLIEKDVFEAVFSGEVDELLVGGGVDSGLEVDVGPVDIEVRPPVPRDAARFYP
jgi:hypothetical protein